MSDKTSVRAVKVVRVETWHRTIPVVVGWDLIADCGCVIYEGMRLDRQPSEPVVGFHSCDAHEQQLTELHRVYRDETHRRAEFDEAGPDDERPLHVVLLERFREAVS